ncbi:hypothetical protein I8752_13645 [Nostocaceae cyanobacterium CENA369]|uniref:Uncharacterized protein n=1 Tax=Dendronalium phyllosphericum CENA369 TaxID=1725256 RepID=A0A8J7I3N7_9NOST|nr:hypothetical protein [Dendronalium phyllosphericum]MBH8574045.1 hypothetical protein [Dendronalium phyllosphericum CENA369]
MFAPNKLPLGLIMGVIVDIEISATVARCQLYVLLIDFAAIASPNSSSFLIRMFDKKC